MAGSIGISQDPYQRQVQIQNNRQVEQQSVSNADKDTLRSFHAGDTISGKVVSISMQPDGQRTAEIDIGGRNISARLDNGMQLSQGQNISFQVRSTDSGTLTLNPLYENTAALNQTAVKALNEANIYPSDDMKQMVTEMMRNGIGIDKDNLTQMSQIVNDNPGKNIGMLVQLKNMEIPVTDGNISQFQNYMNYEHQLVAGAKAIMEELPQAFADMSAQGQQTKALDLYGDLMKLFTADITAKGQDPLNSVVSSSAGEGGNQSGLLNFDITPQVHHTSQSENNNLQQFMESSQDNSDNAALNNMSSSFSNAITEAANDMGVMPETIQNYSGVNAEEGLREQINEAKLAQQNADGQNTVEANAIEQQQNVETVNRVISGIGTENVVKVDSNIDSNATYNSLSPNMQDIVKGLKDIGISSRDISRFYTGDMQAEPVRLMKELLNLYEQSAHTSAQIDRGWSQLFSSKGFTDLLKETIAAQWLLQPQDVSEKKNVEDLYRRLNEQSKQLTSLLENTVGDKSSAFQSSQNMSQNLDFMNQMQQMANYIQLPLKMAGNEAHGDLYVYSNKKHMASDDGSVSALLHLDMANLGPTDIYVKLKGQKVTTNFYMADASCIDLIEKHISILSERLEKRGYSMKCEVLQSGQDASLDAPVDEILRKSERISIISQTSFDARA